MITVSVVIYLSMHLYSSVKYICSLVLAHWAISKLLDELVMR